MGNNACNYCIGNSPPAALIAAWPLRFLCLQVQPGALSHSCCAAGRAVTPARGAVMHPDAVLATTPGARTTTATDVGHPHLQDEEPVVVQVNAFGLEQRGNLLHIHALAADVVVAGVVPAGQRRARQDTADQAAAAAELGMCRLDVACFLSFA